MDDRGFNQIVRDTVINDSPIITEDSYSFSNTQRSYENSPTKFR